MYDHLAFVKIPGIAMQGQAGLITGARPMLRSAGDDTALRLARRNCQAKVVPLVHRGIQANRIAHIIQ